MVNTGQRGSRTFLQLTPNRSATWRQTQFAMALLAAVTIAVASVWSLLGFWLILPFAGLELMIVYGLMYRVCRATYQQQVILFSEDEIEVQWGHQTPTRRWTFRRDAAELEVIQPRHSLSPQSLFLKDDSQSIAVAERLNQDDVKQALACLQAQRLPLKMSGHTEIVAAKGALSEADIDTVR